MAFVILALLVLLVAAVTYGVFFLIFKLVWVIAGKSRNKCNEFFQYAFAFHVLTSKQKFICFQNTLYTKICSMSRQLDQFSKFPVKRLIFLLAFI